MNWRNKNIIVEEVAGKPYCRVADNEHVYFLPSHLCFELREFLNRSSFEGNSLSSLQDWYMSLPIEVRKSIIVVLEQKIA